ncbi:hypothetical protein JCM30471_23120 [Desulfuromonas carbonis]|uniref:TIGR04211 family SH3 domain-containing protein n=1 Tax=Desulfuromonas sp. DDH964 TaxID=1823759 RepID=UPI00078CAC25|nr:TIGR04211 family SH3 domain-containing protein [Desulfuromonas sp. DDH964]AMV73892.1 Chromosome partition protein Smc [Desulfuromonas sp. DDH964]
MARDLVISLIFVLLMLFTLPAAAETRYVSDQLIITLRTEPSTDAPVVTTVRTDTPLEVLAESGRFLKVRSPNGEEGYVLSQYVTDALPKSLQLEQLQAERDQLQRKLKRLEEAQGATSSELEAARRQQETLVTDLQAKLTATEQELATTRNQLTAVSARFEALQQDARDVVAIAAQREELQGERDRLNAELDQLREENNTLLRTGMIQWFLAGGGVFFLGWVVGKISRKKRRGF